MIENIGIKEKHTLKTILSILAIFLPVTVAIYFGFENDKLEKEKYAIEMSPKIKYANRLFLTLFEFGVDSTLYRNYEKLPTDSLKGIRYPLKINIGFNLKLTNIGKGTAKWKKPILLDVDTNIENFAIREYLLKGKNKDNLFTNESESANINTIKELFSNDTVNLSLRKSINALNQNNETTLHLVFFYTGENNVLYDTYMWIHLKIDDTIKYARKNDVQKPHDFVITNVSCCETKIYTGSEKEIIYRKLSFKDE